MTKLLTVLFIGLKLCGVITWSWFWVLSPFLLIDLPIAILEGLLHVDETEYNNKR